MEYNLDALLMGLGLWVLYGLILLRRFKLGGPGFLGFSDTDKAQGGSGPLPHLVRFGPWLKLLAALCLVIALAQPRYGLNAVKTYKEGIAVEMLLDRSSSMNESMKYQGYLLTRLDVVKQVFLEFVLGNGKELAGRPADRIGLISFAGFAEEEAPLTKDHETLSHFVKAMRSAQDFENGTMIGDGLYYAALRLVSAEELFKGQEGIQPIESKVIILLTDGQQTKGGLDPKEAAQFAAENGIKVYSIAIVNEPGMMSGVFSFFDRTLDTSLLEEVAKLSGGRFFKATSGEALREIYQEINELEKTKFEEHFSSYEELFPLFLWMGLALLVAEFLLDRILLRRLI